MSCFNTRKSAMFLKFIIFYYYPLQSGPPCNLLVQKISGNRLRECSSVLCPYDFECVLLLQFSFLGKAESDNVQNLANKGDGPRLRFVF